MKQLNRQNFEAQKHPTKIMQFGEGNFLRAFIDWQIDYLNKHTGLAAGVSIIRPIDYDSLPLLNTQDGLYTTLVRGINEAGEPIEQTSIVECVNEEIPVYTQFNQFMELAELETMQLIFSNTTEAGIAYCETDKLDDAPASSYPGKLTQWLYRRYQYFAGKDEAGLTIIPCELIDYNGEKLKEIVLQYCELWQLESQFVDWLVNANHFCSTLVDRIVTGFPKDEHAELQVKLGYADNFMVTCEYFHLFVIQGPKSLESLLCPPNSELNIKIVDDIFPYKQRKVAILNGAHTALVPLAFMSDLDSVGEAISDPLFERYVEKLVAEEVIPTLDLDKTELESFARDVISRFKNPYVQHMLLSIALNSMTKFKTRLLPQLLKYVTQQNRVPTKMALALAAQILMYRGIRNNETIALNDAPRWLETFVTLWKEFDTGISSERDIVCAVLSAKWHWDIDLTQVPGLVDAVDTALQQMLKTGVRATLQQWMEG